MTPAILGPAPCQGCGVLLTYLRFRFYGDPTDRARSRDGWHEAKPSRSGTRWHRHRCAARGAVA
jgi:hypothetical protein